MPPILVSGGRVNSRDASRLQAGELRTAQDAYYKPYDTAIWKIGGRAAFNSSAESVALVGGAFAEFDSGGTNLFVALGRGATAYRKATAGATGSFSDLTGFDGSNYALLGTATILDSTHYANEHVLMNGVDRNRVVRSGATQMFHSMLIATTAPSLAAHTGTGFTLSTGKVIRYWIEERVKDAAGAILKRSASALVTTVALTGTGATEKPRVFRPVQLNPDATHFAVLATATDGVFPVGAEIGEATITTLYIDDTRTTADPALPGGTAYQTITATIAGTPFTVPKNGPAPISSTGDIFEDSLLMNDASDPSVVLYSVDDAIHAVPSINKFRIGDVKRRDEVVVIRTLDNVAIILGRDAVYRLNTLPRAGIDSMFSPERVKSKVHFAQGCVSAQAAALFSFGEGLRLAYVSRYGVLVTDGAGWDVITDDMDWETDVDITQASKFVLLNNVRYFRLELFYVPPGETRPTRCAFLHYHPTQAKATESGARAKLTWPIRRDANAAFSARINTLDAIISCNEDGRMYVHDSGVTEPVVTGGIQFVIETGELYADGVGESTRLMDLYVHHQAHVGQIGDAYFIERAPGEDDFEKREQIALDRRESTPTGQNGLAESFVFGFSNSDTIGTVGIDYFVPVVRPSGETKEP